MPKPRRPRTQSEMDDSEYESEDFEWRRWPANAYHDDEYYGYVYDSGGHRICKSRSTLLQDDVISFMSIADPERFAFL